MVRVQELASLLASGDVVALAPTVTDPLSTSVVKLLLLAIKFVAAGSISVPAFVQELPL